MAYQAGVPGERNPGKYATTTGLHGPPPRCYSSCSSSSRNQDAASLIIYHSWVWYLGCIESVVAGQLVAIALWGVCVSGVVACLCLAVCDDWLSPTPPLTHSLSLSAGWWTQAVHQPEAPPTALQAQPPLLVSGRPLSLTL